MGKLGRYWKGIVCFGVTVVGGAVAQGLIVGAAGAWCSVLVGALGTLGVVAKGNAR